MPRNSKFLALFLILWASYAQAQYISPVAGTGGGGGATPPGGSPSQVQYNAAGAFGGISGATSDGTTITLVAPILGTPASGTLTNTTGFPVANLAGAGTGVLAWLATPSSANLATAVTGETGSGALVFGTSPTLTSPTIATGLTLSYAAGGGAQCLHVDNSGVVTVTAGSDCGSGGGSPGGSTTQVQYNNAGAFGGITGATTNGTALTLVAPVLGTPASGTLTNTTGFPVANLAGAGTGALAALANPINATNGFATYVLGSSSAFGLVKVDNSTITAAGGVISAVGGGSGTVTSVAAGCGATASPSPITSTGTLSSSVTSRTVSGTSDTILAADCGNIVYFSSASSIAVTQPAPSGAFAAGFFTTLCTTAAGVATVTPGSGTIGGGATYPIPGSGTAAAPVCTTYQSDGTNFNVVPQFIVNANLLTAGTVAAARGGAGTINGALKGNGSGVVSQAACADLSNGAAGCSAALGTGVATALAVNVGSAGAVVTFNGALGTPSSGTATNLTGLPIAGITGLGTGVGTALAANLSANGGMTTTIASGAKALATSAIGSAACSSAQTDTATNTATTDTIIATFNGDPTAITGYVPLTTGMLTVIVYPTSNTVNFKVCNNTSSSITPGAITLNWRVVR